MFNKKLENKSITLRNDSQVELNGVEPGQTVTVETDRNGTPLDRFWRNRLRDAPYDGCVTDVNAASKKQAQKSKKGE